MAARGCGPVEPTRKELERVCRMYRTIRLAARALGIRNVTFTRLCEEHGIATPAQRSGRARTKA